MHQTLIVARMDPADADAVAGIFAESDAGELPHLIGVSRRTLFRFHGLYFHLVEAADDIADRLYATRGHPLYADVNTKLGKHMTPFDPDWKEPKDAMATTFYQWQSGS
ncbi:TcmI family type II polyketide cyclase [Actinoplanes sp. NPDC048791]|uniref:TcmI family type II polyketide cyclase n=1 Tax=Actinoplanes sp. NPDC048791 TaxID=3154623 RepID=UPI00340101F9